MKGVLIVFDGMGDLPHPLLKGKTPLEAANMPNLDFLAARSEFGYMYSVKPGFIPESDEAIVSMFGNELISSSRGQLEAHGVGIKLTRGDLALRANFATVDSKKTIIDRRAGRTLTNDEAESLSRAINNIEMPFKFEFKPTIQHRGVLVFRGGFSDNISGNDSGYFSGRLKNVDKIIPVTPLDDEENSQYTSNILNESLDRVFQVLDKHPVNAKRREKGLLPANYLLVRGAGIEIPKLKIYRNWVSLVYMPLEIGFSKLCGMKTVSFNYPILRELDSYQNLDDGLKKACKYAVKTLKKYRSRSEYAYLHIKETDLPGHDNKPLEKKAMLEYVDKTLFRFMRKFVPQNGMKVVVTADHSTPCRMKSHSSDPVPVMFYNGSPPRPEVKFCERTARTGKLGRIMGKDLLKKVGFVK